MTRFHFRDIMIFMTNLEYLAQFLTETYGAICFHNDSVDGYTTFPKESQLEMETLCVYFPNQLDLEIESVKARLLPSFGSLFYERYTGAKGIKLCTLNGCVLLARFAKNNKTLGITLDKTAYRLPGGVFDVIQYFIGNNIENRILDRPNNYQQPIPTNNEFFIDTGDTIKNKIETFLTKRGLPLVTSKNGFYVSPEQLSRSFEFSKEIQNCFLPQIEQISLLREERFKSFQNAFIKMEKKDFLAFRKVMGLDACPAKKANNFDD